VTNRTRNRFTRRLVRSAVTADCRVEAVYELRRDEILLAIQTNPSLDTTSIDGCRGGEREQLRDLGRLRSTALGPRYHDAFRGLADDPVVRAMAVLTA